MNSLKTVFVMLLLAAVAYGVYVSINRNPETATVPDLAPPWPGASDVQTPGSGGPNVQIPRAGPADAQVPGSGAPHVQLPGPGSSKVQIPGPEAAAEHSSAAGGTGKTSPVFTPPRNAPRPVAPLAQGTRNPLPSDPLSPAQGPTADSLSGRPPQRSLPGKFATYMQNVQGKLDDGQLAEALLALTRLYDDPDLTDEQSRRVTDLLDQLAGTVIYSREHLLEGRPYVVRPGESLEQIAGQYNVPWQLLARINGVRYPQNLPPGQELKVVRGPFNAVIDLSRHELTLMVKGRYAGRFPIGAGTDHPNLEGSYIVRDKTVNPQYYGLDRVEIDADDPNNPLGELWIGLEDRVGIHGTNDPGRIHRTGGRGSICLGDQDIEDVFGILSIGSRVVIRR